MGQVHAVRQTGFHLGVEAHPVADMRQVCPFRAHVINKFQGFFQVEMRMVGFLAEGVYCQDPDTLQPLGFFRFDRFDVCQVGKIPEPEPEYLQSVVPGLHRCHPMAAQTECTSFFDGVYRNRRGPGIPVFIRKNIVKTPLEGSDDPRVGVNGDVALPKEKWTDIIHARRVVGMFVGKEDGIEAGYPVGEHLLPKIRAAVHNAVIPILVGYHYGNAEPFVARVFTEANRIVAPDNGDALGGTGA